MAELCEIKVNNSYSTLADQLSSMITSNLASDSYLGGNYSTDIISTVGTVCEESLEGRFKRLIEEIEATAKEIKAKGLQHEQWALDGLDKLNEISVSY